MKNRLRIFIPAALLLMFAAMSVYYVPGMISVSTSAVEKELPISSVDTDSPYVALNFQVDCNGAGLEKILAALETAHVQGSFFVTEKWLDTYPTAAGRITEGGHDLGILGKRNEPMGRFTEEQIKASLLDASAKIQKLTGLSPRLFCPPYGEYSDTLLRTAEKLGFFSVLWSVDSLDWKDYGTSGILEAVEKSSALENGAVIVLHTGAKYTPKALSSLLELLREKGLKAVPVSEMIYYKGYYIDGKGRQRRA